MKSEFVYDIDPDAVNPDISDANFLSLQRKRAETKLIKTKIVYKMDQGHKLSANEHKYLQQWVKTLEEDESYTIDNHRDTML